MEPAGIYARAIDYLDRYVQVGLAGDRIIAVSFPETPANDAATDHPLLDRLEAYFEGEPVSFESETVALTMATDHRDVLETLRSVPYGEGITVEALTRMTPGLDPDAEADVRLVRSALAENPVPLVVPDHRVRDGPSGAPPGVEQKLRSIEGLA
ncbi:methylated-DNA--protein-cysteinemethyltransferase protein [Halorhabdus tiamatea SARL4B]|uniref:Methylated-DNA--protein-cysteine methyltransferase n=1 Tax=Halorhabdus tiamatea SARL4B TaxID=1033806 RepID=F7PQY1_9EURY|nr:MGMT family protein [Halorhabdus tiamatea]ERJ04603.1 methylated-DNA--protein-cysteinemethyltransferase protein [Halorhabdus tiamatea SARL4B]CCQ34894.1 methylated-DNA--protein-cysteine methyltransferase [Halorhabdus tiamatea SARL4B]